MKKTAQRRSFILEKLDEKGQVSVQELSESLGVSEVTIRNDLDKLEKNNLLIRAHGGHLRLITCFSRAMRKRKLI